MDLTHHVIQRSWFIQAMVKANGGAWPDLEELVSAVYAAHVRPGDMVFDVGVNHGTHLVQLAELVGDRGRVIGVEAVPAFAEHALGLLTHDHGRLAGRVTLHRCAVAAEAGSAQFFVTSITDGGLSGLRLRPVIADAAFERIEVETRTLDMLLPPDRPVRFVKIDIEGGEYDALRGSPALLAQSPLIAFEFDASAPSQFGFQEDELFALLRGAGYAVHDIFGFEVDSGAAMMNAVVWNFVAVPPGLDPVAITAPARRVLEARFPSLVPLAPSPPPSPDMVEAIRRSGGLQGLGGARPDQSVS